MVFVRSRITCPWRNFTSVRNWCVLSPAYGELLHLRWNAGHGLTTRALHTKSPFKAINRSLLSAMERMVRPCDFARRSMMERTWCGDDFQLQTGSGDIHMLRNYLSDPIVTIDISWKNLVDKITIGRGSPIDYKGVWFKGPRPACSEVETS